MPHPEILFFFLAIAFVYASVGFGGGSGYLAVLALYTIPFQEMKLTALVCNIIVVAGGTAIYIRRKELPYKKMLPLVLASVPMAYIGAGLKISQDLFFLILGISLLVAGRLLWRRPVKDEDITEAGNSNFIRELTIGAGIGFLSGMVGIGGGIFLAPVLHLIKWDTPKRIAATASFFILINSTAGILGQLSSITPGINYYSIGALATAVFIGGQFGARIGTGRFSQSLIRRLTAILVFFAGVEVLMKHVSL